MTHTILGTYQDGVLHLQEPLPLADGTQVTITVETVNEESITESSNGSALSERDRIHQIFVDAGLAVPRSREVPPLPRITPEERAKISERLGKVGPLSDIISEERDGI